MTLETIYILRHGFRLDWVTTNWKSPTSFPYDPPLSAFGEAQAEEVANYFLSLPEDQRPTAIFSSPTYRCLQTSKPTSIALGLPIYAESGISEWFSPVEPGTGLHPRPLSTNALKPHFPEIDDSWSSLWYPSPEGEDVDGLHDRAADFLTAFVPEVQRRFAGAHRRVLLVSHVAPVIALARELVGERDLSFRAGCCSLTVLDRKAGDAAQLAVVGGWTQRVLGDSSYLKDGSQRDWGFEDYGKAINDYDIPGAEDKKDGPTGPQI